MKFHANENIESEVVAHLRKIGHDVTYGAEDSPRASDEIVLAKATAQDRFLITCDKDFGELCFRRGRPASGVILIRSQDATPEGRIRLLELLLTGSAPPQRGEFIVVGDRGIRRRALTGK